MDTAITIDDIVDIHPLCYGCDSVNTRIIHPDAKFNDTGQFMIHCLKCGRVRTIREEHLRGLLATEPAPAAQAGQATALHLDTVYQVMVAYRGDTTEGTIYSAKVYADRADADHEAKRMEEAAAREQGWAEAAVVSRSVVWGE